MISIRKVRAIFQPHTDAPAPAARPSSSGRSPRGSALVTPLAPRADLPRTHHPEAKPAATPSGWLHRVTGFFRSNRAAVAGVLAGATVIPGVVGAGLAPLDTTGPALPDPALPPTALVDVNARALANPFAALATPEEKLDLLKVEAGKLEDRARALSPAELKSARDRLLADYVNGGGTIGVAPDANGAGAAKRIAFAEPTVEVTPANVTDFALFKYFWETEGDAGMGLARHGLDELTREGVEKLVAYAKTHDVTGAVKKPELQRIDPDQRAVVKALLDNEHYGAFVELDARPALFAAFGIDPGSVHVPHESLRPVKAGDLDIPSVSNAAASLASIDKTELPARMAAEYQARRAFFEDPRVSAEERGLRTLGLLGDYAGALWSTGERNVTEAVGNALLDVYATFPYAEVFGATDYNGTGWSVAQSLVLGIDPNGFEKRFAEAGPTAKTTYLAMHGEMVGAMAYVDQVLEAKGLPKLAQAFEKKSPLGWMIGEVSGHTKAGNLDEKKPFSSSGLNFGVLLFPGDGEIAKLPPKAGFEFPIDVIDGFNNAVVAKPIWGDHIVVRDERGNELQVEKQIQRDAAGKAVSWSAAFKDANGRAVDPSKVLGVIVNAQGEVKGDGKATRSLDMWWWGFCDRNTAQRLYKSKYAIPELDRDVRIVENGKVIVIPVAEAQKLVDMDIPDLVPRETMSGFRFDEEAQIVKLKDGRTIEARVRDLAMEAGPGAKRVGGDHIAIHDAPGRPMLGTLEVKTQDGDAKPASVDVRYIESITEDANGKVTVKMRDDFQGWPKVVSGTLLTDVPWDRAERAGNGRVLKQTDEFVIRGGFTLELGDGTTERVNASEVSQVIGETARDLRISQFTAWVEQNKGMFATDGSMGVIVSNGMRWVNRFDITQHADAERPDWAPKGALAGTNGPVVRQGGDKIVWIRALAADEPGKAPSSTLYAGFVQVDKSGRIVNEGFTTGQPDFGWSGHGPLNWFARSSFNPHMDPELRLKMFVNGVGDQAKLQKLADQGNLPQNWRDFLTR